MAKKGGQKRARRHRCGGAQREGRKGPPPVHLWNPPFCGDLDMRIATDGTWFYLKTPIGRPALVKLFASVLKREDGQVLPGHAGREGRHHRRRRAVPGGRDEGGRRRGRPRSEFPHQCGRLGRVRPGPRAALRAGARYRRAQALSACAPRSVGQGDARRCSTIWSSWARSAMIDGARMFGVASGGEFFAMAPADSLKEFA